MRADARLVGRRSLLFELVDQLLVPGPAGVLKSHLVVDPLGLEEVDHLTRADEGPVVLRVLARHHESQCRAPRLAHEVDAVLTELAPEDLGDRGAVREVGLESDVRWVDRAVGLRPGCSQVTTT